jgi:hypothetical protein
MHSLHSGNRLKERDVGKQGSADPDRTAEKVRPDEVAMDEAREPKKDQKPSDTASGSAAGKVEIDAEIEDRFEATDN